MTRGIAALTLAAAAVYVTCVARQLDRPLMYDDANFALAARAVADTGLPYGNQGWMSDRGDFSHREQWALWHPPLYIYLEGALSKLGGWTPPVLRLPGLFGGLAAALLTYLIAKQVTRGPPVMREAAGAAAATLFLLCPLVVQSALVVDIDFALMLPLTLLFLSLYLRLEQTRTRWLSLAPLFALLLWAKMTNPLALLAVVTVWQVVGGHPKRAAVQFAGIGLGGAALFGASWLAIGTALGFPLDMPFGVNAVQWQDSAEVARRAYVSPGAFVQGLQPSAIWLGPGLVALGLAGVAIRGGQLTRCWRVRRADVLIGLLIVFVTGYVNKEAGWFPKYQVAIAPVLACLAAPLLAQAWCARPRPTLGAAAVGLVAAAAVTLGLVRDDWALRRTWTIDPVAGAWLLGIGLLAVGVGWRYRAAAPAWGAALVGIALGWSIAVDGYQQQAAYQTDYWYGTRGTLDAAAWLDANVATEDTYLAAKEVAIRAHPERYVDQDNLVYLLSTGRGFRGAWAGEPLKALVLWQRDAYLADLFGRTLPAAGFREVGRFGDYVVYAPSS